MFRTTTNLPIWYCAKESLGERMDKYHNHESIFIKLLDLGIDVLLKKISNNFRHWFLNLIFYLIDLMQIVGNIRNKQHDNICMSWHKSCFFSFFQVLVDSLDEWLYFRPCCRGFGSRRLLDLTILFRLLAFRIRQRWPKSSITGKNGFQNSFYQENFHWKYL